jgi:hypothetical protein
MKKWFISMALTVAAGLTSCNDDKLNAIITVDSEFESTTEDWVADFAEYSTSTADSSLEMAFGRSRLPAVLDSTKYGLRIQGHNRSDDMFMFLKKRVTGLLPNHSYKVVFDINLGTSYPENSVGTGGSPGSSVYLKAGASPNQPVKKLVDEFYTVSIDKGQQASEGKEMVVLGNVSNGLETYDYRLVSRTNSGKPVSVTANANGEIWLCVGSDSGFEGLTVLYYDKIKATITAEDGN